MIKPIFSELKIPNLKRSYKIVQITDIHLSRCYDDELFTDDREIGWLDAQNHPCAGELSKEDMLDLLCKYADSLSPDAVALTGDLLNTPTRHNLDSLYHSLAFLHCPVIYAFGNHDWSCLYSDGGYINFEFGKKSRPLFHPITDGNDYFRALDLGEFSICSIDNTLSDRDGIYLRDSVTEFAAYYEECGKSGKPVILIQHIPFWPDDDFTAESKRIWKYDISLGGKGQYGGISTVSDMYRLCAKEKSSPVKAVICGHVHFSHDGILENGTPEFITGAASDGICRIITVN